MWQCALVLSIISAVSSQVVIDDSVVPRAKESDLSLILRNFDNKIKGYYSFTDVAGLNEDMQEQRQFRSKIQFQKIGNNDLILIGAMDAAYVLNLTLAKYPQKGGMVTWKPTDFEGCRSFLSSQNPLQRNFACHNHIRYFNLLPGDESRFLLCGSNGYLPNCVTVKVDDLNNEPVNISDQTPNDKRSIELVQKNPMKSFVAIPRGLEVDDSVLVNALTVSDSNQGALGIYNVSVSSPEQVTAEEIAFTNPDVTNIIEAPQEFVSLFNLDYKLESEDPDSQDYIYVVFKEELKQLQQSSSNCVTRNRKVQSWISRIARICKSDVAVSNTMKQPRSFVKADIYCNIKSTSNLQLDYAFQEIAGFEVVQDSIPSSDISEPTMYGYGLFSEGGSSFGPAGSAVCIYPAERTVASGTGSQNNNNGLYDIFLRQYLGGTHNRNYNCSNNAATRLTDDDYTNVEIESPLTQIGDYPLFVLDGIHLTKIQVDPRRPILKDTKTIFRDVVFVASLRGRIYKVTVVDGQPVISDIIQLRNENGQDDTSPVYNLELRETNSESPYLFASTNSSIYRLPASDCGRYNSCFNCLKARDPYCFWDLNNMICTSVKKSLDEVPSSFMQNVFGNESVFNFDKCQREEIPKEPLQDSTDTPNDALIPVTIVSVLLVVSLLLISVVGIALYARYRHLRKDSHTVNDNGSNHYNNPDALEASYKGSTINNGNQAKSPPQTQNGTSAGDGNA